MTNLSVSAVPPKTFRDMVMQRTAHYSEDVHKYTNMCGMAVGAVEVFALLKSGDVSQDELELQVNEFAEWLDDQMKARVDCGIRAIEKSVGEFEELDKLAKEAKRDHDRMQRYLLLGIAIFCIALGYALSSILP